MREEESSENQTEANSANQSSSGVNQAGGIAAAGFKKFIKKSISIRIKQNDQVGTDSEKQAQDAKEDLKQQYQRLITSGSKTQLNLKQNERKNVNDEVTNELKSLLELDNRNNMTGGKPLMMSSGIGMNQHLPPPHLQNQQHYMHHHQQQQQQQQPQINPMQQFNDYQRYILNFVDLRC